MRVPIRRALLAAVSALWLAAAPSAAAAPCRCPQDARDAAAAEAAEGCHSDTAAPEESRDVPDPCGSSCGACATAGALPEGRPAAAASIAVHRDRLAAPPMRAGERRPPDHVPLASL